MFSKILKLILIYLLVHLSIFAESQGQKVLVLYSKNYSKDDNNNMIQDSLEIALYYQKKRLVPKPNLLGVMTPAKYPGRIDWEQFQSDILWALKKKLNLLGRDNIDYILICKGIPYTITFGKNKVKVLDNCLMAPFFSDKIKGKYPNLKDPLIAIKNPYFEATPLIGYDKKRFEEEKQKWPSKLFQIYGDIYLTSRIDGITTDRAKELIDGALYAQRYLYPEKGYYHGNIYYDTRFANYKFDKLTRKQINVIRSGKYNTYGDADLNIAFMTKFLEYMKFPLRWENTSESKNIGHIEARFKDGSSAVEAPDVMFYGGWYNSGFGEHWSWLPGSVRCDLHSLSMKGFPYGSRGSQALRDGASAVCGTMYEPYLTGHQRPNVLLYYLLSGYSFGEAAALSTPIINWVCINVGDPLYTPLAKGKMKVKDFHKPKLSKGYPKTEPAEDMGADRIIYVKVKSSYFPEVVSCKVLYGTTKSYGHHTKFTRAYFRRHKIRLYNLEPETVYYYKLILKDPVGNTTISKNYQFKTGVNKNPAFISNVRKIEINEGETKTFSIRLSNEPKNNKAVFFDLKCDGVKLDKKKCTFTSWNYNKKQIIKISSQIDKNCDDENGEILIRDNKQSIFPLKIQVFVKDTEPGKYFSISANHLNLTEGDSKRITLKLLEPIKKKIAIKVQSKGGDDSIKYRPSLLYFKPENWDRPRDILIVSEKDEDTYDDYKLIWIICDHFNDRRKVVIHVTDKNGR